MTMTNLLKDISEYVIQKIVDTPDDVNVDVQTTTKNVLVNVKVDRPDTGKVIGRNGRTIEAIKTIIIAVKNTKYPDDKRKVSVEILEDESSGQSFWKNK